MTSWSFSGPKIEYECDEKKKALDLLIKGMHRLTHIDREQLVKAAIWQLERYLEEKVGKEKYGSEGEDIEEDDEACRDDGDGRGDAEVPAYRQVQIEEQEYKEEDKEVEVDLKAENGGIRVTFSAFLNDLRVEDIEE